MEHSWHQIYGSRSRRPGQILARAYTMARSHQWDQMRSYLAWEVAQPLGPAMGQVQALERAVRHIDGIDPLFYRHMTKARLLHRRGLLEQAAAHTGWLLELMPPDHPEHANVKAAHQHLDRCLHPKEGTP